MTSLASRAVPVAGVPTTAINGDGHDQCNDGCHDNQADDCSQYDGCHQHVAVACGRYGCGIHLSLAALICQLCVSEAGRH